MWCRLTITDKTDRGRAVYHCATCNRDAISRTGKIPRRPCEKSAAPPSTDCRHRSSPIGLMECPSCKGTVQMKVFECQLLFQPCAMTAKLTEKDVLDCTACEWREG